MSPEQESRTDDRICRGGRSSAGFSRACRVAGSSVFHEAFAQGARYPGRFMVLLLRRGADARLRLGVVASRKVGPAVKRNRAKRLLREAYRLNRLKLQGAFDLIVVARRGITEARLAGVERELLSLASKAGILRGET